MRSVGRYVWMACAVCCWISQASAANNDWAEGNSTWDGTTREFYNGAAFLPWNHLMGDWVDAKGVAQGNTPYAVTTVVDDDTVKPVQWDVTQLVKEWLSGKHQNQGFFLRTSKGNTVFYSREYQSIVRRPTLLIHCSNAPSLRLWPEADTILAKSTAYSQGRTTELRTRSGSSPIHSLLRFNLSRAQGLTITRASLQLYTPRQYGLASIGVYRCQQGSDNLPREPQLGLAARYKNDKDISRDPNVLFATDFEATNWAREWTNVSPASAVTVVEDEEHHFEPLLGKALSVLMASGTQTALNTSYRFRAESQPEPEEVYFRYYLRLGSDWNQTVDGGKLPGICGRYGSGGWGGRPADGTNGWSTRGLFDRTIPPNNPLTGTTPIGLYAYHADMEEAYGDLWRWQIGCGGFLARNQWYSIEHYVKLNTPGQKNGIVRGWVDGRLAFEKTDIRFRDLDRLKIEEIWMDVYHGGTEPSPRDQHLYIDNVVVARAYIGPMIRP